MNNLNPLRILMPIVILLSLFPGCASNDKFIQLQSRYSDLSSRFVTLQRMYSEEKEQRIKGEKTLKLMEIELKQADLFLTRCSEKNKRLETTPIAQCINNLDNCQNNRVTLQNYIKDKVAMYEREKEEDFVRCNRSISQEGDKAYAQGQLSVWQSLSISATPSSVRKYIFFYDHFLTFRVNIMGKKIIEYMVKTERKEDELFQAFDAVFPFARIHRALPLRKAFAQKSYRGASTNR